MKRNISLIVLALLLIGCGTSENAVQTAIAETEARKPTETFTPVPTDTPSPTFTPTSTQTPSVTPTPTETNTPSPEPTDTSKPLGAFNEIFEEMEENFSEWLGITKFEYVYDLWDLPVYHGVDIQTGIHVYTMDRDGVAGGFMMSFSENPLFDTEKQAIAIAATVMHYYGQDGLDWMSDNWPKEAEDSTTIIYETSNGTAGMTFENDGENSYYLL